MSKITSMILITGPDDKAVGELNVWCRDYDSARRQEFCQLNPDQAGGVKVLTMDVWAMGANYFPWQNLVDALGTFSWDFPEDVVLVVDDEDTDQHIVYRVGVGLDSGRTILRFTSRR